MYSTSTCLVLVYECNCRRATLNFAQKYAATGVNVTYQEVLSKGLRGGDMFGRKRSSIRANTEIFWLLQFCIPYKLKWSVQNILPEEEKKTQKSITREQAPRLVIPSSEKSKRSTERGNLPLRPSEIWRLPPPGVFQSFASIISCEGESRPLAKVIMAHGAKFMCLACMSCVLLFIFCLKNAK